MISFLCRTDKMPEVSLSGKVSIPGPNNHFKRKPAEYILYFITSGNRLEKPKDMNDEYFSIIDF